SYELAVATFTERYISRDAALEQYLAATKAGPAEPMPWTQLIGFYIRSGRFADASAADDEALRALPNVAAIKAYKQDLEILKHHVNRPELQPLLESLSRDPSSVPGVETLKVIDEIRTTSK